jgi:hypothetical protein
MSHPFDHLTPGQRRIAIDNYNRAVEDYNKGLLDATNSIAAALDDGIKASEEHPACLPGLWAARSIVSEALGLITSGEITIKKLEEDT